jgi:tetratricopeptide (TPR) repeat protein
MSKYQYRLLCTLIIAAMLLTSWPTESVRGQGAATNAPRDGLHLFESLRREAFDAFYSLDYKTSRKLFQQIMDQIPEHPAGHLYMATQVWVDLLNSTRRLQADIYSSESFYSETEDKVDPKVDRQFRGHVQKAIEKAEARLVKNGQDVDARYFLGAAHAVLAVYQATVTREFFGGLKNGRRAVSEHRKIVKQDPNFADAYLSIGMYDYVVGSLPLWVKIIATIGGIRGNKERGIKELHRVVEKGKYAKFDAQVLLIAIYVREEQPQKALNLIQELVDRYPRNYYLPIEAANLQVKIGRAKEGFSAFDAMLRNKQFQEVYDLIHFQYARTLAAQNARSAALEHYRRVTTLPGASVQLVSLAHLHIGQLLDLRNEREAAIEHYKTVLGRENVFDSHEQAQRYLRKPFTGKE